MLKNNRYFYILFLILMVLPAALHAQARPEDDAPPPDQMEEPPPRRPNLLRELNLTAGQIKQIREINQANREKIRADLERKREAERLLDEAIYADEPDDNLIRERLQVVQQIQTEMMRMRTLTEFAVRKILTDEQLSRFRELRQSFLRNRESRDENRPGQRRNNRRERLKNKIKPNPNSPGN